MLLFFKLNEGPTELLNPLLYKKGSNFCWGFSLFE